jgi:hypothetical protein
MREDELEQDVRVTSEHVSATARRINELEAEKRTLDADDPRVVGLSDEIERLAVTLRRQADVEGDLSREAQSK